MGISTVHDDTPAWLRYNFGGKSVDYDYTSLVKFAETDTSVRLDIPNRTFIVNAEKHTDSFTAAEIGSIMHIADIGDVDISGVMNNSLFVYKKDSDCGEGCEGINNSWTAWNSNDDANLVESFSTVMGFDANGNPKALNRPNDTTKYYQLTWAGANKVKWTTPTVVANAPVDSDNKKWAVYVDPQTMALVIVKENP